MCARLPATAREPAAETVGQRRRGGAASFRHLAQVTRPGGKVTSWSEGVGKPRPRFPHPLILLTSSEWTGWPFCSFGFP
jgi:hypothetical protein